MTTKHQQHIPEELREMYALLEAQGLRPQLCDTPVPYYDNAVHCGRPTDVGDIVNGDYQLMPHDIVHRDTVVIIRAEGDSMIDAGIEDGDQVHMLIGAPIRDGDQVVVCIDGESTLKSYFRDTDGVVWLVACNDKYDAIEVTEGMDVRIIGKVVRCVKDMPSSTFRYMQQAVARTKRNRADGDTLARTYNEDDLRGILRKVLGDEMVAAADWVAVYRILVDKCGAPTSHTAFAEFINALELDEYPPCTRDLLRKADAVYMRPIYEWDKVDIRSSAHDRRIAIAKQLRALFK